MRRQDFVKALLFDLVTAAYQVRHAEADSEWYVRCLERNIRSFIDESASSGVSELPYSGRYHLRVHLTLDDVFSQTEKTLEDVSLDSFVKEKIRELLYKLKSKFVIELS